MQGGVPTTHSSHWIWVSLLVMSLVMSVSLTSLSTPAAAASGAASGSIDVADLLDRLSERAHLPVGLKFRQDVTLKAFLFTWRFHSELSQGETGLSAVTTGAPSIVPKSIAVDLFDVVRTPLIFDLEVVGEEEGLIHLHGERINYPGNGPLEGSFWVDPDSGTIVRAEAVYDWGRLYLDQEYEERDGLTLLVEQRAKVTPFGASLVVAYSDYTFP